MDKELDNYLCSHYSHVFADRHGDMRSTCMCWGFEVGNGWFKLLNEAAMKLELLIVAHIKTYEKESNPFPWFMLNSWYGIEWSIRYPLVAIRAFMKWAKIALGFQAAEPWWPRASQVKEKYGTLRFYLTSGTREMYAITVKAARQSSVTCEICGKKGKLRGQGWFYTRCTPCWKRENK